MKWNNALSAHQTARGVHIHRFTSLPRRRHTWHALDFGLRGYSRSRKPFFEPFVLYGNGPIAPAMGVALLRNAGSYDLVHIASLHYAHAWIAFHAARQRGVPVVLTPLVHIDQPETFDVGYMRRIVQNSQLVFAVTEAERDFLARERLTEHAVVGGGGLHADRFPPIDKAAARARLSLTRDAFIVLFLGRKTAYKGLETCVQAVASLRTRRPNAMLLAVGPETEYSQQIWARHRHAEGLSVRAAVSDADRLDALAACDVLVLPSAGESFGIVYLEAWAYAKPVIGADIPAVASLIDHGQDGFLVDAGDAAQLAGRLEVLAAQPDLARLLGENGQYKLHARYTWQRIGDIVEGAYARLLRSQPSHRGVAACT